MAYIAYVPSARLDPADRVDDPDHIIQIHAVHPAVMRLHHALYVQVMHRPGLCRCAHPGSRRHDRRARAGLA
jgi:hypothetical protein